MKAAPFGYHRAGTVAEIVEVLAAYEGSCRVLAGGQSLIPMVNMRLLQPDAVVDANGVEALSHVERRGDVLVIGAMVRYRDLERSATIAREAPLLARVLPHIGDRQVRNRGTIGGSLAQGDPTGEVPLACLTMAASVTVVGPEGSRTIPVSEFYVDSYATALDPLEVLTEVHVPMRSGPAAFLECCRRHNDFAVVSVACTGRREGDGSWHDLRIGVGGAAPTPVLAEAVAAALDGSTLDDDDLQAAAREVQASLDPPSDIRATAEYRRHLAPVYVERTLRRMRAQAAA